MSVVRDIYGAVFARGSAVLLARVASADGEPVESSDIASAAYWIEEIDPCGANVGAPVPGHDGVSLSVGAIISDTLLTTPPWDVDEVGYNLRHEIDVSSDAAFPEANRAYSVRYELTPVSGQTIVFRFQIEAI